MEENEIAYLIVLHKGVQYNVAVKAMKPVVGQLHNLDFEIFVNGEHTYTIHPAIDGSGASSWSVKWPEGENVNEFVQEVGAEIERYYL